ncbi:hypothetical protein A2U01_0064794, partial [Trifolium medium]|nr:hypothetical protein [Trifolium medium]
MREVEQKLITARLERSINHVSPSTAMWIDIFIDK